MSRTSVVLVLRTLVLASTMSALVGCGHQPWKMVREAPPPSPLKGAGPVSVSFDYSKIQIANKSEAQWVQDKTAEDPQYPQKWSDLKASFETNFVTGLRAGWPAGAQAAPPGAPGVHLVVSPTSLSIGHYMVFAATPTVVTTNIVYAVDGKDAEEISTNAERFASVIEPSVFQHVPAVAETLGRYSAKFLASRN
jgi:hypothetical protein